MMTRFTSRIILLHLVLINCANSQPCTSPVSYYSTDFTIRGPCPYDTVLAAVGSTVHYRCDYEDRRQGLDLPYWHIAGLTGTPFVVEETNDHDIAVTFDSSAGYTTVSIVVQEQYLNNTIDIQCGLCSGPVCYGNGDRLSENITSTSLIKLVAYGSPSDLVVHSSSQRETVSLYWSPPPVSTDYTEPVLFTYAVTLTSVVNPSQSIEFTTNNTQLNISVLDIPVVHDECSGYNWNVGVISKGNSRTQQVVSSDNTVLIPSGPQIDMESFSSNLTDCMNSFKLNTLLRVRSCQSAGKLHSSVHLMLGPVIESTTSATIMEDNVYIIMNEFSIPPITTIVEEEVMNGTVSVTLTNNYGTVRTVFELEEGVNLNDVMEDNQCVVAMSNFDVPSVDLDNTNNATHSTSAVIMPYHLISAHYTDSIELGPSPSCCSTSISWYLLYCRGCITIALYIAIFTVFIGSACHFLYLFLAKRMRQPLTKPVEETTDGREV